MGVRPDNNSLNNGLASAAHRFGTKMPVPDQKLLNTFKRFAKSYIFRYIPQVQATDVPTFDQWVAKYPGQRRAYLTKLHEDSNTYDFHDWLISYFQKWEDYGKLTAAPRGINHMSDKFKVFAGPSIHAADKSLYGLRLGPFRGSDFCKDKDDEGYARPGFVKGTDPSTWGRRQELLFGHDPVSTTDFSSFEAHHIGAMAEVVAFWLNHALRPLGLPSSIRTIIHESVIGNNKLRGKGLRMQIKQRLMSGNLWTSSANGLLNLLINSFLYSYDPRKSIEDMVRTSHSFRILVEGDDAIFEYHTRNRDLIARMGLMYKLEDFRDYGEASFCSTFRSLRDGSPYMRPDKFLLKFFTMHMKFDSDRQERAMMRAKAYSYGSLYPHCPVIGHICRHVLDQTRSIDCRTQLESLRASSYNLRDIAILPWSKIGGESVTESSRRDYCLLFGIEPASLRRMEADISRWDINLDDYQLARHRDLARMQAISRSNDHVSSWEPTTALLATDFIKPIPGWSSNRPYLTMRVV